jgi:hypothetical protein
MKLSEHFSLSEFTQSSTAIRLGIQNIASPAIIGNLKMVADNMEKVRDILGTPIFITSGYRSLKLNRAIGSSDNSDHVLGYACDFKSPQFGTPDDIVRALKDSDIQYHQLICEGGQTGWVHVSYNPKMKRETLNALFDNKGKASYRIFV